MHWEYFRVLLKVQFSDRNFVFRHFMEVAEFLDSALSQNGKCFVNCVFGRSRSEPTTFILLITWRNSLLQVHNLRGCLSHAQIWLECFGGSQTHKGFQTCWGKKFRISIRLDQVWPTFQINEGFLQQLADLDYKLGWYKQKLQEEKQW